MDFFCGCCFSNRPFLLEKPKPEVSEQKTPFQSRMGKEVIQRGHRPTPGEGGGRRVCAGRCRAEPASQVCIKAKGQAKEKRFLQNLGLPVPHKEIPGAKGPERLPGSRWPHEGSQDTGKAVPLSPPRGLEPQGPGLAGSKLERPRAPSRGPSLLWTLPAEYMEGQGQLQGAARAAKAHSETGEWAPVHSSERWDPPGLAARRETPALQSPGQRGCSGVRGSRHLPGASVSASAQWG